MEKISIKKSFSLIYIVQTSHLNERSEFNRMNFEFLFLAANLAEFNLNSAKARNNPNHGF
jgi:hypothetical protein